MTNVFIKSRYVRSAKAYIGDAVPKDTSNIHDAKYDTNWQDIQSDVRIMTLDTVDENEIKEKLKQVYPNASSDIFRIETIPAKLRIYKMKLRFKLDISITEIDDVMRLFHITEPAKITDGLTIYLEQTIPYIPDKDTIEKYANTIEQNYKSTLITTRGCRFDGYEYIYDVTDEIHLRDCR